MTRYLPLLAVFLLAASPRVCSTTEPAAGTIPVIDARDSGPVSLPEIRPGDKVTEKGNKKIVERATQVDERPTGPEPLRWKGESELYYFKTEQYTEGDTVKTRMYLY